jgi:hypothetical protein
MLIRFAVANYRSVKDPVELSLVAVDEDRAAVRKFDRLSEGILPLAAIYGPNASGKSNVLDAVNWLATSVRASLSQWDGAIPREPFRFADFKDAPTVFEADFMFRGVRHVYSLHVTSERVLLEELLSYPERRARQLFVREGDVVHFRRGIHSATGLRELVTPTTLVLSLARRFEVPELQGPARYLASISNPFAGPRASRVGTGGRMMRLGVFAGNTHSTRRLFFDAYRTEREASPISSSPPPTIREVDAARTMLRHADLGISDVLVSEQQDPSSPEQSRLDLRLVHEAGEERAEFDLSEESDGTQMWFRLIGPTLSALRQGRPLLLDEIDASLHPKLSARLLDVFRSPTSNPYNAQLIFTTHDTTLMAELNRDEVWLTEKGDDGATRLTALAEYGGDRVRRSVNLERAYLQGRFGALPRVPESPTGTYLTRESDPDLGHGASQEASAFAEDVADSMESLF